VVEKEKRATGSLKSGGSSKEGIRLWGKNPPKGGCPLSSEKNSCKQKKTMGNGGKTLCPLRLHHWMVGMHTGKEGTGQKVRGHLLSLRGGGGGALLQGNK